MKGVVVREVRQFLHRPHNKLKAVYNGVVFLAGVTLGKGDGAVAAQLVECYMSLFERSVKEGELGSRLLASLLAGANRAYPFLRDTAPLEQHMDALFKIVHTASFTSSTQALMLLSNLAAAASKGDKGDKGDNGEKGGEAQEGDLVKRYYRALYAKLLSEEVCAGGDG
jgi:ribosome biogenesis protein MAK21